VIKIVSRERWNTTVWLDRNRWFYCYLSSWYLTVILSLDFLRDFEKMSPLHANGATCRRLWHDNPMTYLLGKSSGKEVINAPFTGWPTFFVKLPKGVELQHTGTVHREYLSRSSRSWLLFKHLRGCLFYWLVPNHVVFLAHLNLMRQSL
jgi:hypothetical protein